jgi:SAM-dependent methyltransferase
MSKRPVNPNWFPTPNWKKRFEWLAPLSALVESIANFGCSLGSDEPFLLMWTLDATEVKVIEKEKEHVNAAKEELENLRTENPGCLEGRCVKFVIADMLSTTEAELPSNYFDLAYCDEVLYYMEPDCQKVQDAINVMARVVKPGGWIIAVESKIGAEFKEVTDDFESKLFGRKINKPVRVSDPKNISPLFEAAGLVRCSLEDAPEYSYCYRKPFN